MAYTTNPITRTPSAAALIAWPLRALSAAFARVGRGLVSMAEANARVKHAEYLYSLSDAELERLRLSRDRIAHHVFRDLYFV